MHYIIFYIELYKSSSNRIHAILDVFDKDIYNKAVTDSIDFNLPTTKIVSIDPKEILTNMLT